MRGVNIGFACMTDETQFDTTDRQEIAELWLEFCIENGFIDYIEEVEIID